MNVIKLTCQNCGANLEIKDNVAFCEYCGAKLALNDESQTITYNYNHTYIKRDEARIRENETREKVRLQKLEYKERKEKRDITIGLVCGFGIPLIIILVILLGSVPRIPSPDGQNQARQAAAAPAKIQGVFVGESSSMAIMSDGSVVSEGESFQDSRISWIGGDGIHLENGNTIRYK